MSEQRQGFRTFPAKTVTAWHAKSWLDPVVVYLASHQSFQGLLGLNAQRVNERKAVAW